MEDCEDYDTSRSNTPELDNKTFDDNRQNNNNNKSILNPFSHFSPYSPLSVLSLCNSPLFLTPSPAPSKSTFNLFNRSIPSSISISTLEQTKSSNRVNFRSIAELATSSSTPNSNSHEDSGYNSILTTSENQKMSSSIDNDDSCDESQDENAQVSVEKKVDSSLAKTDMNGKKKNRTQFTDNQKWALDRFYATQSYPDPSQMELLSRQLSLEEKVIRVWFQNKRSRDKTRLPRFSHHSHTQTTTPMNSTPTRTIAPSSWPFAYNPPLFY
ncbi:unnamed protein product [Didymodactylos carnosus]|uniref:Homeobox domain-containing protein n=1 Tax=Didymodactylos carnosus TaxID=1234261 RepID=A0A814GC60_9BILA|nr:unnamed protein product [Didymodactylos carnosus]CAF0994845.1 unnamed protein product [Didymodactylos carnosus]CAF3520414.1 unnamed protein product [Didymodactylos carnosus]CAF3766455.1 unnamed protein product [Didymodactylos carnosus]